MRRSVIAAGLFACLLALAAASPAQEPHTTTPAARPFEVRHVLRAADSILSTPERGVSLEAFRNDTVTGVYLKGSFQGQDESIGFGRGAEGMRYLWFSIGGTPGVEHVALLYDLDHDLTAEFMLLRTIDMNRRTDYAIEYRAPSVRDESFDITLQPACVLPRCDPSSWTERPRRTVHVAPEWFEPSRSLLSLAAARGEQWLGRPVALLRDPPPDAPP
ncbi:MAG: hypothetical protein ACREK5_06300 [Gemmatimonadota bacterium]